MSNNRRFSLDDFKKWMKDQRTLDEEADRPKRPAKSSSNLIGMLIQSKLEDAGRVSANIRAEAGNIDDLAVEFADQGGTIIGINGKEFLVEVDSGTFYIKRAFVKKKN